MILNAKRGGAAALLERDETLSLNPVRRLRRQWYAQPRRTRYVNEAELVAFYRAADGLDNRVFGDYFKLMLFTGLRRNEAAELRWSEIDFAAQMIRLPAARTKPGRVFDLPMSSFVRELLIARRALGNANGWVFPGRDLIFAHKCLWTQKTEWASKGAWGPLARNSSWRRQSICHGSARASARMRACRAIGWPRRYANGWAGRIAVVARRRWPAASI